MAKKKIDKPKTAAIYARFSSHLQHEESIDQQVNECRAFAAANGYDVVAIYSDEAMTGRNDRRPQYQKLKRDAAKELFAYVIAYKSNRLARNMFNALQFESEMQMLGIDVLYAKEEFGNNAAGRFALRMMMNVNQFYSENMGEDIKRALDDNVRNGKVNGKPPYGLCKGEDGKYAIQEDEARIVREIFRRYSNGESMADIQFDLNLRNIPAKRGEPWRKNSINATLKNEKYIGVYTYGDIRIEDIIPPIISKEQFYEVQELMKHRHISHRRNDEIDDFVLTGKLFCGLCGERMTGISGTSRSGEKYYYYECYGRKNGTSCEKENVRKEFIEDFVAKKVVDTVFNDDTIEWIVDTVMEYQKNQDVSSEKTIIQTEIAEVTTGINNIMKAIEKGILTDTTKDRLVELEEKKRNLNQRLLVIQADEINVTRDQIKEYLRSFANGDVSDPKYKKSIIQTFVSKIYLYDDEIKILYDFNGKEDRIHLDKNEIVLGGGVRLNSSCLHDEKDAVTRLFVFLEQNTKNKTAAFRRCFDHLRKRQFLYSFPNANTVVVSYFSPGRRTTFVNPSWFIESGIA